ncbi:hypothetical protein GWK47_020585 [Chionoecetes opilio]|uniref:Uncharacterized protein n=1 Tax=Chionoecetes opilio TaxID=41210 RepID=A0A8J5BW53_CHIOP|nr:hypothetical protein GWK47_020585 [Chionoecetes opilio]
MWCRRAPSGGSAGPLPGPLRRAALKVIIKTVSGYCLSICLARWQASGRRHRPHGRGLREGYAAGLPPPPTTCCPSGVLPLRLPATPSSCYPQPRPLPTSRRICLGAAEGSTRALKLLTRRPGPHSPSRSPGPSSTSTSIGLLHKDRGHQNCLFPPGCLERGVGTAGMANQDMHASTPSLAAVVMGCQYESPTTSMWWGCIGVVKFPQANLWPRIDSELQFGCATQPWPGTSSPLPLASATTENPPRQVLVWSFDP